MNSENSKTLYPHRLLLSLTKKQKLQIRNCINKFHTLQDI